MSDEMDVSELNKLKGRRQIPIAQVVNRPINREVRKPIKSVKAVNVFISPRNDDFKKTIDDIRVTLDTLRSLHAHLRGIIEAAYDKSIQDINNLKADIDQRRDTNKPFISSTKQLNRAIAHSAALYTALAPIYQAEAIANSTRPNEYLTEIVSKVNAV